jgi:hypothetical protein
MPITFAGSRPKLHLSPFSSHDNQAMSNETPGFSARPSHGSSIYATKTNPQILVDFSAGSSINAKLAHFCAESGHFVHFAVFRLRAREL